MQPSPPSISRTLFILPNWNSRPIKHSFCPPSAPGKHILLSVTMNVTILSFQFSSASQLCPTLCNPMDCSMPGFPVHHQLPHSLLKLMSIETMMPSSHLILCHPLLLLPSLFPRIRFFSSESVLCIRCPSYWSFSFSISASNEYSGLMSLRMDWLDLLAVTILDALLSVESYSLCLLCLAYFT